MRRTLTALAVLAGAATPANRTIVGPFLAHLNGFPL